MLFCGIVSWAQDFNPTNPAEPGQLTSKLKLQANPADAGSVSGGGDIVPGTSVTVRASAKTGWEFVNWTSESGEVATSSSYTFTKGAMTETLTANFRYNPNGPSEPGELPKKLTLKASDGGSVSGGGFYLKDREVNIYAYAKSTFEFEGWYYEDGECYSTVASTTYTMGEEPCTLTARFKFNPDSPSEPGEVNGWRLKLTAQDGGTVNAQNYNLKEGEATTIYAHPNSGYIFTGWYQGETKISDASQYVYTMGGSSTTLEAHFLFSPSSPGEPGYIEQRKFSFNLKNVITKPGVTAQFPILLTPLATLGDMTFQLNFDPRLNVDLENVVLAETSTAYSLTREEVTSDEATYDEGYNSYRFTLTGGTMVASEDETPTVTSILTFPIIIPEDAETATSYKITINQISITKEDGTTQTAGTKNGRVSVYKLGDTNGDNEVNSADVLNIVTIALQKETDVFIEEVSDVNDDGEFTSADVLGIVNIVLEK